MLVFSTCWKESSGHHSHVRGGSAQCLDGENPALTLARLATRFAAYLRYSQLCKVLS